MQKGQMHATKCCLLIMFVELCWAPTKQAPSWAPTKQAPQRCPITVPFIERKVRNWHKAQDPRHQLYVLNEWMLPAQSICGQLGDSSSGRQLTHESTEGNVSEIIRLEATLTWELCGSLPQSSGSRYTIHCAATTPINRTRLALIRQRLCQT